MPLTWLKVLIRMGRRPGDLSWGQGLCAGSGVRLKSGREAVIILAEFWGEWDLTPVDWESGEGKAHIPDADD